MMNIKHRTLLSLAGASIGIVGPAMAQTSERTLKLEEITVTAKAREQNLQDVPLAISVLSEADLDVRGISDVQDLADYTPNLEISSPVGRRESEFAVRGLGVSTTDERYQAVGFFLDGIWMGGQVVGLSTADVERIEVIKGPHSTFGRATYGASIDYVTKTPSLQEFNGSVRAQYSNFAEAGDNGNHEVTASIAGPLVEGRLSGSLFAQQRFDAGVAPALGGNQGIDVGEEETTLFSGVLYAEFSDTTSLKFRAMYTEDSDTIINGYDSGPQYWVQQGANVVQNAAGQAWISGAIPDAVRENYYSGDYRPDRVHIGGTAPGTFDREKLFLSAIFNHEFDNGYSLSIKGSHMEQDENALFDGLAAPGRFGGIDVTLGDVAGLPLGFGGGFENVIGEEWEERSLTVRLLSPADEALTWSVGAFYYDSENTNSTPRGTFDPNAGAPQILVPAFGGAPDNTTGINRVEEIDQLALFGAVSLRLNDEFRLSLEGRYQEETIGRQAVPRAFFSTQRVAVPFDRDESNFDPRVTLSYEPNDNHHFYVLLAQGHKSGRFNLSVPFRLPDGTINPRDPLTDSHDPNEFVYVEPEELKNYELGWKANFLDGRARSNVAVFFQDVENQQFVSGFVDNAGNSFTSLANVGESKIHGIEADLTLAVTDRWLLQGAVGYNDQEFQSDVPPQQTADLYLFQLAGDAAGQETLQGKSFANVSKVTANLSGTYTAPISIMGSQEWSVRTDVLYKGKRYIDSANLGYIPANTRVNLRASLTGENWTLSAFAMNLFDDKTAYRGNSFPCGVNAINDPAVANELGLSAPAPFTALPGGQRCLSIMPSNSREVGISFQLNF